MMRVAIRGGGTAAAGCAHLLGRAGVAVSRDLAARPSVPAVMLSDAALALMRDVFDRPLLFTGHPRIVRRIVRWGDGSVREMPHGATLLPEAQIWEALASAVEAEALDAPPDFTIDTAATTTHVHAFGDRHATASAVRLRDPRGRDECRIEAVGSGWLFLMPRGADKGILLAIGAPAPQLLEESRLIAPVIDVDGAASRPFAAAPRMANALAGPDRLACGSAAVGFDPICGDGAAQSVREAILAVAVVAGIAEGGDPDALLSHYRLMLIAAMRRHLMLCLQFYASGGEGPWWQAQREALRDGYDHCTRLLAAEPPPRFELHGFRLVARRMAA